VPSRNSQAALEPGATEQSPPQQADLAIIGAGILGLAVARELILRRPERTVCVLEREREIAMHQTGHSSGVVHAGIYYLPGSLKARLCVEGSRELYEYCEVHGVAAERCGKLIIATDASELGGLDELQRRGEANGVAGLRRIGAEEIGELEPHARGIAALHSPATGVADFPGLAQALAAEIVGAGSTVATGCGVHALAPAGRRLRVSHSRGVLEARNAIACAGGWADRLAVAAGADRDPRIIPFRGAYLRLLPARRHLVRSLIYPVPDPSLPFLGVHLTRQIDGEVLIGPTALMAGARDAYRLGRVRRRDLVETLSWPGTWRLLSRSGPSALTELRHAAMRSAFVGAAARYVPELQSADVIGAFAGVRAQALGRDGRLLDDFAFSRTERALHVRNAPSPAATSALAIARHIADQAEGAFGQD
jgi:2-hydroxyglutarate dehydrogenase